MQVLGPSWEAYEASHDSTRNAPGVPLEQNLQEPSLGVGLYPRDNARSVALRLKQLDESLR